LDLLFVNKIEECLYTEVRSCKDMALSDHDMVISRFKVEREMKQSEKKEAPADMEKEQVLAEFDFFKLKEHEWASLKDAVALHSWEINEDKSAQEKYDILCQSLYQICVHSCSHECLGFEQQMHRGATSPLNRIRSSDGTSNSVERRYLGEANRERVSARR